MLGVIVEGFDLHGKPSASACDALRDMLAQHHLVFFPDANVSFEEHRRLLRVFGHVYDECQDGSYYSLVQNRISSHSDEGEELDFHCDYSFLAYPVRVVSLYGVDVPKVCASTRFANGIRACQELSPTLKARLEGRMVLHADRLPPVTSGQVSASHVEDKEYSNTLHPAILTHPVTGDEVLFFNRYLCVRVEGLSRAQSDALLSEVFAHLYAPDNVYEHCWRPGDLIIFDNIALSHKRDKGGSRVLRRMLVR